MKKFMKELKDNKLKIIYRDGYIELYNKDNLMYVEGKSKIKDIEKIIFTFKDKDDLEDKCYEMLGFELRFCECCGKPMNAGYTDDWGDFYTCEECFPKRMDKEYGEGNWRRCKNKNGKCNDIGGYYEFLDLDDGEWSDEASYYTEWF